MALEFLSVGSTRDLYTAGLQEIQKQLFSEKRLSVGTLMDAIATLYLLNTWFLRSAGRTYNFHSTVRRWYQVLLELPPTIEMEVAWLSVNFKVTVEGHHPVEGTVLLGRTQSIGWHLHKKIHGTIIVP